MTEKQVIVLAKELTGEENYNLALVSMLGVNFTFFKNIVIALEKNIIIKSKWLNIEEVQEIYSLVEATDSTNKDSILSKLKSAYNKCIELPLPEVYTLAINTFNLNSKLQKRDIVYKRMFISNLLCKEGYTFREIGSKVGNKDHSTISYYIKQSGILENNEEYIKLTNPIKNFIENRKGIKNIGNENTIADN